MGADQEILLSEINVVDENEWCTAKLSNHADSVTWETMGLKAGSCFKWLGG